jgi:hypothetical protein
MTTALRSITAPRNGKLIDRNSHFRIAGLSSLRDLEAIDKERL